MDLTHAVDRVEAIRRKFGVESLAPQLAACREMLKGGGVVDVAVLGQFKAGKSSFLNVLIGASDRAGRRPAVDRRGHQDRVWAEGAGHRPRTRGQTVRGSVWPGWPSSSRSGETPRTKSGWQWSTWSLPPSHRTRGSDSSTRRGWAAYSRTTRGCPGSGCPASGRPSSPSASTIPFPKTTCCSSTTCPRILPRRPSC